MKELDDGTIIEFVEPPTNHRAYLDIYGSRIEGSRARGSVRGIEMDFESEETCNSSSDEKIKVTIAVECSIINTEQGDGTILKVHRETSCNPTIVVLHEAGCPTYFISDYAWYLYWKPSLLGAAYICFGLILGFLGKKAFTLVVSTNVTVFGIIHLLWVPVAVMEVGQSKVAFMITLGVLAVLTLIAVFAMNRKGCVGLTLVLLATCTGYLVGEMLFAVVYAIFDHYSLVAYLSLTFAPVIILAVSTIIKRRSFILMTYLIGICSGFLTVRGISLICGGYPADAVILTEVRNDIPPEITVTIWGYLVGSVCMSLIYLCFLSV